MGQTALRKLSKNSNSIILKARKCPYCIVLQIVIFTLGRPSTLTPEDGDTRVGLSQSWKSTVWINTTLFKRTFFKLNFHMHGSLRKTIGSKTARRLLKIWLRKDIYSRQVTNQWRIMYFITLGGSNCVLVV